MGVTHLGRELRAMFEPWNGTLGKDPSWPLATIVDCWMTYQTHTNSTGEERVSDLDIGRKSGDNAYPLRPLEGVLGVQIRA